MKKIGFTGTREGMTKAQITAFSELIRGIDFGEFHHGDCVGSDKETHDLISLYRDVAKKNIKLIGHPPIYKKSRANCKFDMEFPPDDFIDRNHHIVNNTNVLIATPRKKEELRSGTWSTIRYARKEHKPVYIIEPNGNISLEFNNFKKELK